MNQDRIKPSLACIFLVVSVVVSADASRGFSSGVAAGDVTENSAIIWVRPDWLTVVRFELATDEAFTAIEQQTELLASPDADLTIKLALSNLVPNTEYFYRFTTVGAPEITSPVGRFRTAPPADEPAPLRFVFSGDVGYRFAPFPAFAQLAREDADFFLWFGDTVYADDVAAEGGAATTLDDYRLKYREIRGDPSVQEALAALPVWTGWDDHEVTDNYAGADPAFSADQIEAAYQAFFEYMPLQDQQIEDDPYRTYRRFHWGSQIEFFVLDGRQYRDPSAEAACGGNPDPFGIVLGPLAVSGVCRDTLSQQRSLLGQEQLEWLMQGLAESTATVKFVLNDVPMSYLGVLPYDRWDGYDAERRTLLEFINEHEITGVHLLTTDFHSNWYNPDLTRYFRARRTEYSLPNDVPVVEAIVGPLGVDTFYASIVEMAADLLGITADPLLSSLLAGLEQNVTGRLQCESGFSFVETDRVTYLLVDVTADGAVEIAYRGSDSGDVDDPNAATETLYSTAAERTASAPCCLPLVLLALVGGPALASREPRRRCRN